MLIKDLEKEMKTFAKAQEFEKAAQVRHTIYALNHIQDVSLIKGNMRRKMRKSFASRHTMLHICPARIRRG